MRKPFLGFLLAPLVALAGISTSHAAISLVNYDGFAIVQSGNSWNFHHESAENSALKGGTIYGKDAASVSTSQPLTVQTKGTVPVGKGAVIDVQAKIPRANMAKALVASAKLAGAVALPTVASLALDALLDYGLKNIRVGEDGTLQADGEDQAIYAISTGYKFLDATGNWTYDLAGACKSYNPIYTPLAAGICTHDGVNIAMGLQMEGASDKCPAGWYVQGATKCSKDRPLTPMTEQSVADWIAARDGWPTSSALALAGMLQYPDTRKILTPYPDNGVTLTGPPSVQGKSSTQNESVKLLPGTNTVAPPGTAQTDPGTRTSTTTTTHPLSYSGNSVTHSTVNNTTTNITNNTTNVTTTETKTEEIEDDSEEQSPTDTALGDVPKLYQKKYPDGMSGVWNSKKEEFAQTSFFALIDQLTPKVGQSGTCPSWSIDLSWTPGGSMGVHELQPPCMIWPILKLVVIISALFLARSLIFGG